jgi:membrane protein implicated in regulation of membrane protease activity
MDDLLYLLWFILGVVLMVAEIFTAGFVLLWFGVGAIAAAIVGFIGGGLVLQFITFAVVSIALTALSRTILYDYLPRDGRMIKTGMESLPGRIGTVAEGSRGSLNEAAVKVFGTTWTAFPIDGDTQLVEGEKVEVVEVRGSSIYVRRSPRELPGWRDDDQT